MEFVGKVALVTGGSRGIGKSIAAVFAQEGAAVAIAYATRAPDADGVVSALRKAGRRALAVHADVSKTGEVSTLIEQVLKAWGRIDVLVNNAGIVVRTPWDHLTIQEWDTVVRVNLTGAFLCSQMAAPALKASSGSIVNVTSVNGLIGSRSAVAYDASKGGLQALTKTLARALAPAVRVNAVAPGFTDTDMQAHLTLEQRTHLGERIPLGRFAEPDEIARMVLFLASQRASYITGQTLIADGGITMW